MSTDVYRCLLCSDTTVVQAATWWLLKATGCYRLLQVATARNPIATGGYISGGLLQRYNCYRVYMALLITFPFS